RDESMPGGTGRDANHPLTTSDVAGSTTARSGETTRPGTRAIADQKQGDGIHHPSDDREEPTPLFRPEEAGGFRSRWDSVQTTFVDDPRHAVEEADHLVAEAIQRLAQVFADERNELERQWDRGSDISTEDLRLALQKYRSFFHRLLAA